MENNIFVLPKGKGDLPIDTNKIQDSIEENVSVLEDYDEIVLRLTQFYEFGKAVQSVSHGLLERVHKENLDRLVKTHQKERERLLETKPRKERFSTKEVSEITGIKSETTLLKYFNKGTIVAHKDASDRWYVLREDLRNYVGHDNF